MIDLATKYSRMERWKKSTGHRSAFGAGTALSSERMPIRLAASYWSVSENGSRGTGWSRISQSLSAIFPRSLFW
jgi:hypothetical protein